MAGCGPPRSHWSSIYNRLPQSSSPSTSAKVPTIKNPARNKTRNSTEAHGRIERWLAPSIRKIQFKSQQERPWKSTTNKRTPPIIWCNRSQQRQGLHLSRLDPIKSTHFCWIRKFLWTQIWKNQYSSTASLQYCSNYSPVAAPLSFYIALANCFVLLHLQGCH